MAIFTDHLMRQLATPCEEEIGLLTGQEAVHLMPSVAISARVPPSMKSSQHDTYERSMRDFFTRCKELGFSVTSAMQAALGCACKIQSGKSKIINHCNMAIYDARSKHIDLHKYPVERLVGSNIFVMPALFKHPPGQLFVESAKAAKAEFSRFLKDDIVCAASQNFGPDLIQLLTSAAAQPGFKDKDTPGDLNHSSLGVIDKWVKSHYQSATKSPKLDVEVIDLWFALDLLHPNILVDTWTFGGMLNVELIYNETFHSEESISLICTLIREQLTQGLCLDLEFSVGNPREETWKDKV